ncbi:2-keto-4-pentenoate hydratase [Jannaschia pagri]|uniref:2-keto-4-pentenoate hydratase n=1 Tax=Jannaschia pagri TaxID=2829797 RepID=A0ABQ4NP55_9RHOB|nr:MULTISPECIES: fumarylacetoacetate hydrolase family protein [unclassified Jannaschia]GIT92351.1 2-keto-4-pentenoate hydratase [Jannaschia sp. AI_61]GIT96186.1 2-keto-4-pentenoate hydratase [Jannaschia sp. AI_62]
MRLATVNDRLVLVSEDAQTCVPAQSVSLLAALRGGSYAPDGDALALDPAQCAAPLPVSHTFLDGSAYVNHVDLVRRARGAEMPERFWTDPLMYQGCAVFEAPNAPILADPAWGTDFEAELAVITGDVPCGASPEEGAAAIRFVTVLNDISLRALIPDELSKGFGFVQSKPPSACAPFAVSPEALPGWDGARLHGTMCIDLNGKPFGRVQTGEGMTFDFGQLVAHAAKTRALPAGTVIGSGTVSNRDAQGGPGQPVADGGLGYACIAEQRTVETLAHGGPRTPFLTEGDQVTIWFEDTEGNRPFGDISQTVKHRAGHD